MSAPLRTCTLLYRTFGARIEQLSRRKADISIFVQNRAWAICGISKSYRMVLLLWKC